MTKLLDQFKDAMALHHSAKFDALLSKNPDFDVDEQDQYGGTLLMFAIEIRSLTYVDKLIGLGANVNHQDKSGITPLMICVIEYSPKHLICDDASLNVLKRLVEKGADLDLRDFDGQTALMMASSRNFMACVSALIKYKANLNLQDENGWTALMFALKADNHESLYQLIDADADVNLNNKNGETVIDVCQQIIKTHYSTDKFKKVLPVLETLSEKQKLDVTIADKIIVDQENFSF